MAYNAIYRAVSIDPWLWTFLNEVHLILRLYRTFKYLVHSLICYCIFALMKKNVYFRSIICKWPPSVFGHSHIHQMFVYKRGVIVTFSLQKEWRRIYKYYISLSFPIFSLVDLVLLFVFFFVFFFGGGGFVLFCLFGFFFCIFVQKKGWRLNLKTISKWHFASWAVSRVWLSYT